MRKGSFAAFGVTLLAGLLVAATPGTGVAADRDGGTHVTAALTGTEEIPGPGDPDGKGDAKVTVVHDRVCFELRWHRIEAPASAHIHRGSSGVAGPVVVALFVAPGGLPANLSGVDGCVDGVDRHLARDIVANPGGFYVNIHNADFPDGAVRGQLRHDHH